jgi:hypothetical protein
MMQWCHGVDVGCELKQWLRARVMSRKLNARYLQAVLRRLPALTVAVHTAICHTSTSNDRDRIDKKLHHLLC